MTADWAGALCAEVDPELWFPEQPGDRARAAKAICAECPLRARCLDVALADSSLLGVWGGTSAAQRQALRARHPVVAA